MEVRGALVTLLLFASCTAVPLPWEAAAKPDHEELAPAETGLPVTYLSAATPESANSTLLQEANAARAIKFFDKGVTTVTITTPSSKGLASKDVNTVHSGEADLVTTVSGTPVPHQQATTQGFLELHKDILDYELSSLKNKPADRLVTVPDSPGSSVAPITENDSTLEDAVQLAKPTHAPNGSDIYEAPVSSLHAFLGDRELTTPMSASAFNVTSETKKKDMRISTVHFVEAPHIVELTSKISPNEEPSTTMSAIQNYSKLQGLTESTNIMDARTPYADAPTTAAVEPNVIPTIEGGTKGLLPESSQDFQQAFSLSTQASSEELDISGEEDVELQLESLVTIQSPTVNPSETQTLTKQPSTATSTNFTPDDVALTPVLTTQSSTLTTSYPLEPASNMPPGNEGVSKETEAFHWNTSSPLEPVTDMPPVNESVSKETEAQSSESTSVLGTEPPDVQAEQKTPSNETTTTIALEHATVPLLQNGTSQTSDNEPSSTTLPFTYSPPLENMKPNATAGITAIWEAGTVWQEIPLVYNTSAQASLLHADTATLPLSTSTISTLTAAGISLGAAATEAQSQSYLESTPEREKTAGTSTEAFNPSYSDETFHTEVSKDSSPRYTSLYSVSQSPDGNTEFSPTYALDATTQELGTGGNTVVAPSQRVGSNTITDIVLPTAMLSTVLADHDTERYATRGAVLESMPTADIASTTATSVDGQIITPERSGNLHENESTHLVTKTSTKHMLQKETAHRELETTQAPSEFMQVPSDLPSTTMAELASTPPPLHRNVEASEELVSYAPVNDTTASAPTLEQDTQPPIVRGAQNGASPVVPDVSISVTPEREAPQFTGSDGFSPPAVPPTRATSTEPTVPSERAGPDDSSPSATPPTTTTGTTSSPPVTTYLAPPRKVGCVPLEPPRSPTHEFRLVFNTSAEFSWEQVEALEQRIQHFARDDVCPRRFARTAFALGPPHVLSWTDPSANSSWCDRAAVDALLRTMRANSGQPTPEVTRAFYPEFRIVAVELRYRGACADRRSAVAPIAATVVGVVAALVAGLATLLWRTLRRLSRSRKLDVTAAQPSFDLKQRRPILLPGENRPGTNGTPSKSPHTKPNPPFVVDTDFCYINPNFLEVVKPSPPPPPPYRRSMDRRVRSLEAVLPPPRPPHGPHSTLGSRSLRNTTPAAEQDEGTSSSSGVESDAQPSGEAKSNESS